MYDCQQCGACCISPSVAYGYVRLAGLESMRLNHLGLPVIAEQRTMYLGTNPFYGEGGERICEIFGSDSPKDKWVKLARAHLISAAPDLLLALRDIMARGLNQATVERGAAVIRVAEATGDSSSESV